MKNSHILLNHGSGGKLSRKLVSDIFFKYFDNDMLNSGTDSAIVEVPPELLAFTTDSFVVDPLFFPGWDIGKLAVCGTVNDLAVSGAEPKYLSTGFIIEEGFPLNDLEKIVKSMAETANSCNVKIVTGDTKVVNRGQCDKLFINTSGIGLLNKKYKNISSGIDIKPGDKIIVNGTIADHGISVMAARNELNVSADVISDCAPLNQMISEVLGNGSIKFMRDATRGGLATVLAELKEGRNWGLEIYESKIKIRENVRGMCEFFGFDPLYIANEGKVVIVVDQNSAKEILKTIKKNKFGKDASIIGEVVESNPGKTILKTKIGGRRMIDMLSGDQLPRIC
ncbi:MAG: hydrogenase expression/formation protein HypE [Mariniphaga sp.]|nr:hydrogenase expression/formation protein HypE [Mariniphaga sp.]